MRCLFRTNANCEEKQLERKKDNLFIHLMISCCWWLLRSCMCGSEACFNFQEVCANILVFIFSLAIPKVSSGAVVSGIDTCSLTSKIYLCWSSFCVKIVQCEIWNEQKKEISFPFKLQEFFWGGFSFSLCNCPLLLGPSLSPPLPGSRSKVNIGNRWKHMRRCSSLADRDNELEVEWGTTG